MPLPRQSDGGSAWPEDQFDRWRSIGFGAIAPISVAPLVLRRDRAAADFAAYAFLRDAMVDALLDRLDLVKRDFVHALDLGCADGSLGRALGQRGIEVTSCDAGAVFARTAGGMQADEDALPFAAESFDLIVSAGVLDTVNDLPGALVQCRRALKPDGLFLAGFVGAGSLPRLKAAVAAADMIAGGAVPARFHPGIDARANISNWCS